MLYKYLQYTHMTRQRKVRQCLITIYDDDYDESAIPYMEVRELVSKGVREYRGPSACNACMPA
jgi:hypothetical protein